MNLSEVLDAALPELPSTRVARGRPPRLDPDLVVREDVLDGEEVVSILQRSKGNFFRFSPGQWAFAQLFDGVRSYEEVAALFTEQTGEPVTPEYARTFAETLEASGFWFKTPQEKNLALSQKLVAERARRAGRKSKINFAHMRFSGWDPDRYLTWLDGLAGKYIYSPWCVLAVVVLFLFEASVFITQWNLIGPDVKLYYNFTHKSFLDLAQFWLLFLALGFIHESAHGLTCKHFGGQVHSMGLMFLYLLPAFYVDVTEVWIYATKLQRLATIIAGIWIEMVVCGLGMIVWLNTQPGQWLHDFAYQLILITGIAVIMINLNPLIKLDGYYFLTEAIGIPDLKETSTAFLTGWFQSRILRMKAEMPVVARRRAPFFILYALVSGAYSYMILFFVIRFTYNVASHWLAEFALIPSGALAFAIFGSRIRSARNVTQRVWEQNLDSGRKLRPVHYAIAALLTAFLFIPLWRDRENAYYVIEPAHTTAIHAAVPGKVNAVFVREGDTVRAGQPLMRISSPMAASMRSAAAAQSGDSSFKAFDAQLHGQSIGGAAAQQAASLRSSNLAGEAQSSQVVLAPAGGTILTQDPAALLDRDVADGQPLLELAESGPRVVRVYIPASALDRIPAGAEVALALPDRFAVLRIPLAPPGGDAVPLPPGLIPRQDYKGIKLPDFYASRMSLPISAGDPPFGMAGNAKVFGARRSLAGRLFNTASNLVKAHLW